MTTHRAEIPTGQFEAILAGMSRHDLRRIGEIPFRPGDTVDYAEVDPASGNATGRTLEAGVSYVTWDENKCALSDMGLRPGFAILSLAEARISSRAGQGSGAT